MSDSNHDILDNKGDIHLQSDKKKSENIVSRNKNRSVFNEGNLELTDIEAIGPTTAKKLKEAGIVSVMDLAVTSAEPVLLT